MVDSMKPGSVIVDLAVERGGNVEARASPARSWTHNGVKIVGHLNVPGRLAATASSLYAKNLYAFVETLIDKETKALAVKWDDELVKATCLTRDGAIVHPPSSRPLNPSKGRTSWRRSRPNRPSSRPERRPTAAQTRGRCGPGHRRSGRRCGRRCRAAVTHGAVDPTVFRLAIFVLAIFVGYYVVW